MVKLSKAPSGTMFMKGRVDSVMGQLYIITFDLEFTTVHDWAALGNYAEQNSKKDISSSVYNNEYLMPSVIMRDKYIYRDNLTSQTIYPSADIVVVSAGDVYDFTTLVEKEHHIEKIESGKTPLPEKIVFEIGYFPQIKCWNPSENKLGEDITVYSNNINGLQDIVLNVVADTYKLSYVANYNDLKQVELTLSYEGVVDSYDNRFVLADVVEYNDNEYEMPSASLVFRNKPVNVYKGGSYIIDVEVNNSNNIPYAVDDAYNLISAIKDNKIFLNIPIDFAAADITFGIAIKDPLPTDINRVVVERFE